MLIKILKEDLHLIAIIVASIGAVILETLGILPEGYISSIILLLLALLAIFQIIHASRLEEAQEKITNRLSEIEQKVSDPEILLIKPPHLFTQSDALAQSNKGEVWFFNLCSYMFLSDEVCEHFIKPHLFNKQTKSLTFVMKQQEKEMWDKEIAPKIAKYKNADKILMPIYKDIEENIAFVMIQSRTDIEEREALLAIWGEPFMAAFNPVDAYQAYVPRYYLYLKSFSDLTPRLKDIWDKYKFKR